MASGKLTFPPTSEFHVDLRRRVDAYFAERGVSRAANAAMVMKTVFWLVVTYGGLAVVVSESVPFLALLPLWMVVGFGLAGIGFNIGHDAIHGSYSEKRWVNALLSWTFDIMGASSFTWITAHNTVHHTYTNVPGVDGDLEAGFTLAFYPQQTRVWHRFQHIYAWLLYTLTGFVWVYVKDFDQMRRKDPLTGRGAGLRDWGKMLLGKALHVGIFLAMPLVVMDAPVWQVLLGYALMLGTAGLMLAVVFQLAHCIEGTIFPQSPRDGQRMSEPWAEHQLRTTANFGRTRLATFIVGGLDHQIEHHLMPRVCHIHYPKLAPIVEQCARDHGLPYIHNGSFFSAVAAHYRTMKRIGQGAPLRVEVAEPVRA